jgi:hypothetical protein
MSGVFAILTILATGVILWYLVKPGSQGPSLVATGFSGLSQFWSTALNPK